MSTTSAVSTPREASEAAVETAAGIVVAQNNLECLGDEPQLQTLCWALGESIGYENGLREFAAALLAQDRTVDNILDRETALDLIEAKIELLSEYKLDYPQDYDDDDIATMHAEIDRLNALCERLTARCSTTA